TMRALLINAGGKARRVAVPALGERRYWGLMRLVDAMLGNSSSALIEAPVAHLPAVNVGSRQKGRIRGGNLPAAPGEAAAIAAALRQALPPEFRDRVRAAPSPFGDGRSAARVVAALRSWTPPRPPVKRAIEVAV